jgi:hypothetical protein
LESYNPNSRVIKPEFRGERVEAREGMKVPLNLKSDMARIKKNFESHGTFATCEPLDA